MNKKALDQWDACRLCATCKTGELQRVTKPADLPGYEFDYEMCVCPICGSETVLPDQIERNRLKNKAVFMRIVDKHLSDH